MGTGVSNWTLARTVSGAGQLGVVSGTVIDTIVARRLQLGDPGDHIQRALAHFPVKSIAERVIKSFLIKGGKQPDQPFKRIPLYSVRPSKKLLELTVAANFAEVFLAKEGHDRPVGINYMEKLQIPNLAAFYGAMLAGVDFVLMGAGIPVQIPGVLDGLALHRPVEIRLNVENPVAGEDYRMQFDPREVFGDIGEDLKRPQFFPIVSSATLASMLVNKSSGKVDGFIVEGPTAGGHNAPPRGAMELNERGEPVYGPRDEVDISKLKELGLPFYMAGSYALPEKLREALELGAEGIQVGTAFALCEESGLAPDLKEQVLMSVLDGTFDVFTDPLGSPSGFPFKVARLEGTLSEDEVHQERPRICDLGYLRRVYRKDDGSLGYRCPAEPLDQYVAKGGDVADTLGRKCLCNALVTNVGLPQLQNTGYLEHPLVTLGDDVTLVRRLISKDNLSYSALDVIDALLDGNA